MTWFKVDDKSAFHSKVIKAGNDAWGALCRAGAWSSGEATDGLIPTEIALMIAPKKVWDRLEKCGGEGRKGLVERTKSGWQIHDFSDWNPPAELVKAEQAARHEKARKAAVVRWEKVAQQRAASNAHGNAPSIPQALERAVPQATPQASPEHMLPAGAPAHDPVPSRPVRISESERETCVRACVSAEAGEKAPQEVPCTGSPPKDWKPDELAYAVGSEVNLSKAEVDRVGKVFLEHYTASPNMAVRDWNAQFRKYIRREPEFRRGHRQSLGLPDVSSKNPAHLPFKPPKVDRATPEQDREWAAKLGELAETLKADQANQRPRIALPDSGEEAFQISPLQTRTGPPERDPTDGKGTLALPNLDAANGLLDASVDKL